MKKFLVHILGNWEILIIIAILILASFKAYCSNTLGLKDFWINLAAGFVGSLLTIIVIDFLQEQRKQLQYKDSDKITAKELHDLSALVIHYIGSRLGLKLVDYFKGDSKKAVKSLYGGLKNTDIEKTLENFDKKKWEELQLYLIYIKSSMDESILVHKEHVSGKVLGLLFSLRSSFKDLYWIFGLTYEGWMVDGKKPPKDLSKQIAEGIEKTLSSANNLMKET